MPLLTLLLLLPASGAALISVLPGQRVRIIQAIALSAAAAAMLLSWGLLSMFDPDMAGLQFFENVPWNPRLGTSYALGLDGFSLPMVLLATLLCFITLLASSSIRERAKWYFVLVLVLESAMLGVFMAQDWTLFYLLWELTLIPLFFLIDRWGGRRRHQAALNFVLYTMGGSVFMLDQPAGTLRCHTRALLRHGQHGRRCPNAAGTYPGADLFRLPDRFRGQDVDLPHPWLAASGTRGGAQPDFHSALRHTAEDGLLWPDSRSDHAAGGDRWPCSRCWRGWPCSV